MGHCENCKHWLCAVDVTYDDGSVVSSGKVLVAQRLIQLHKHPSGLGHCEKLDREFPADFGCGYFIEDSWDHTEHYRKNGEPWQHSRNDTCPECNGVGHGCGRCVGIGKVRFYDDGFVGEEKTRLHPREKKILEEKGSLIPKCIQCGKDLDIQWVSCPYCGARTNKPSPLEVIPYEPGAVQGTTDEMIMAARRRRESQSAVVADQQFVPPPAPPGEAA